MLPILILLIIVAIAIPFIVGILKKLVKIPVKLQPLLPLALGLAIGIIFFFIPRLKLPLQEAVLFGLAAGGLGTIIYDFVSGLMENKQ